MRQRLGVAWVVLSLSCAALAACGDDHNDTAPDASSGSGGDSGSGGSSGGGGAAGSGNTSGGGGASGSGGASCATGCTIDCVQGCFDLGPCVAVGNGALDLHANIETIGAVLTLGSAPETAELFYRRAGESQWWKGPTMVRIPDGRIAGSSFGHDPDTDYEIRVHAGTAISCASTRTLPQLAVGIFSHELWVDASAPNANGTGSDAAPFKTITAAIDAAVGGTVIHIRYGIYREELVITQQGSAQSSLLLSAEAGAILDGSSDAAITWQSEGGNVWSAPWTGDPRYVSRDQARMYHYISMADLNAGNGYNDVPISEGFVVDGGRLYVRTLDAPSGHTWQVPVLNTAIQLDGASHVWIEGLEIRFYGEGDYAKGIDVTNNSDHVVIRDNHVHNIPNNIWVRRDSSDVRIQDNVLYQSTVYSWPWDAVKATDHENSAITLAGGRGAIVSGNRIHDIFNGVYVGSFDDDQNPALAFDADVTNNDLMRIGDDAFEPEGAAVNARFRGNRVDQFHNGVSLAPITFGPTWVLRNLFTNYDESGFKVSNDSSGRVWLLHNTCYTDLADQNGMNVSGQFTNMVFRNNVIRGTSYAIELTQTVTGNDLDYDALYTSRGVPRIKWNDVRYDDIAAMCTATQLECHGVGGDPLLDTGAFFAPLATSPLINSAERIYGINDSFNGAGPDIGYVESASIN